MFAINLSAGAVSKANPILYIRQPVWTINAVTLDVELSHKGNREVRQYCGQIAPRIAIWFALVTLYPRLRLPHPVYDIYLLHLSISFRSSPLSLPPSPPPVPYVSLIISLNVSVASRCSVYSNFQLSSIHQFTYRWTSHPRRGWYKLKIFHERTWFEFEYLRILEKEKVFDDVWTVVHFDSNL